MPTLTDYQLRVPKYLQIAEHLREDINTGRLQPGDRLPSFSEMRVLFKAGQDTVERVHALLEKEELIYREHGRGVFVNHPRTRRMTSFVAFLDNKLLRNQPYHQEILRGMRKQAAEHGSSIILLDDPATFRQWDLVDGLILEDARYSSLVESTEFRQRKLPTVRLLFEEPDISSVSAEDEAGITMAVDHLVELGHRRIGYLGIDVEGNPLLEKRFRAYQQALRSHGIVTRPEWSFLRSGHGDSDFHSCGHSDYHSFGFNSMETWLGQGWKKLNLTAVVVQNDHAAVGVIQALEENKIRVPQDVSIMGFDGIPIPFYDLSKLTTVKVPLYEMGAVAMKLLLQEINNSSLERKVVQLPVRLLVGGSTAVPGKTNQV